MKELIKWKYIKAVNVWEGTIKGDTESKLSIQGLLCVTDLRGCYDSDTFVSPKSYKIIGLTVEEAKQLAEDLVTGANFEKHESNRMAWIAEEEKTMKLLSEVDELLERYK